MIAGLAGVSYWQLAPAGTVEATGSQATAPVFDSARAFEHLKQMVAIGPRPSGSPQLRQTRAYITRQLSSFGLKVEEQPFTAQTPIGPIEMVNLIVRLPGKRQDRLLITGHYDTKLFKDQVFVGASDGASSGAFLIELARVLKDQPRELTHELVWFDGEEAVIAWDKDKDSTYGSRYYVQAAQKAGAVKTIKAMVLIDMIGDRDLQIRRDSNSTPWLNEVVWAAARRVGHGGTFVDEPTAIEDDHLPFLKVGIPSVDIIDLDYTAWHHQQECCDDISRVSARSLQIVGDVVIAALPDIEKRLLR
jgi:Zn-dependent M28 family amino/carboxypeptidase